MRSNDNRNSNTWGLVDQCFLNFQLYINHLGSCENEESYPLVCGAGPEILLLTRSPLPLVPLFNGPHFE